MLTIDVILHAAWQRPFRLDITFDLTCHVPWVNHASATLCQQTLRRAKSHVHHTSSGHGQNL